MRGYLSKAFLIATAAVSLSASSFVRAQDRHQAPDIHTPAGQEFFIQMCAAKPSPETPAGQECLQAAEKSPDFAKAVKAATPLKLIR